MASNFSFTSEQLAALMQNPEQFNAFMQLIQPAVIQPAPAVTPKKKKFCKTDLQKRTPIDINTLIEKMYVTIDMIRLNKKDFLYACIASGLEGLDEDEWPFVCSNRQTNAFHYFKDGKWCHDTNFMGILYDNVMWKFMRYILYVKDNYKQLGMHSDREPQEIILTILANEEDGKTYSKSACVKNLLNRFCDTVAI